MTQRKLTPKELQVLLTAKWDTSKTYSTLSSTPHPTEEQQEEAVEAIKRFLLAQQAKMYNSIYMNGYPDPNKYQEPERDEQGTLYGYKVLLFQDYITSPQYPMHWTPDGLGMADRVPTEKNSHGIYCTKRDSDEQIHWYYSRYRNTGFVVKCALFGEAVIETETGFRSHKAQIVAVHDGRSWITFEEMMNYGNRKNGQDSYGHTRSYPRDYPQTNWKAYYTYDPSTED